MASSSANAFTRRKKSTSHYCCVLGCHNSYRNTAGKQPKVEFYRFQWKWYEADRRQRWITAVRRACPNGDLWQPIRGPTLICSTHFVGNKASKVASHPAYVPTVFPPCYRRNDADPPASKLDRYERVQRRREMTSATTSEAAIPANEDSCDDSSTSFTDEKSPLIVRTDD